MFSLLFFDFTYRKQLQDIAFHYQLIDTITVTLNIYFNLAEINLSPINFWLLDYE